MENQTNIQLQFFQRIRDQLPGHISLVEDIAELLEISNDSAYRRIRGEKPLSLQEVGRLCRHYRFSVDELLGSCSTNSVTFQTNMLDQENYSFLDWLRNLLSHMVKTSSAEEAETMFILNELNIFQILQVPEVFAFKLFFWQKSNLDFEKFRNSRFSLDKQNEATDEVAHEIVDHYIKINTIELTTEECLSSYLKQIVYYSEAGYFETRNDATKLCEKLLELVDHQQRQAELGYKFHFGKQPAGKEGNYQLYHNDIILADNTILIKTGNLQTTFITSNAINLLQTQNKDFYQYNFNWGRNLMAKSILISGTAEKERNRFFRKLEEQIGSVADQL
jgi:hypothetical protein